MNRPRLALSVLGALMIPALVHTGYGQAQAEGQSAATSAGRTLWGVDDERGNGNTQGVDTRLRCAAFLAQPTARVYELGRVVSATMPQNPFGDAPVALQYLGTRGIPFTRHAGNGEVFTGGIGSQGTQFDALGHFGFLDALLPKIGSVHLWQTRNVDDYLTFRHIPIHPSQRADLGWVDVRRVIATVRRERPETPFVMEYPGWFPEPWKDLDYRDGVTWLQDILTTSS